MSSSIGRSPGPFSAQDEYLFLVPTSTTRIWDSSLIVRKRILSSVNRSQLSKSQRYKELQIDRCHSHSSVISKGYIIRDADFYSAQCSATMYSSDYMERIKQTTITMTPLLSIVYVQFCQRHVVGIHFAV